MAKVRIEAEINATPEQVRRLVRTVSRARPCLSHQTNQHRGPHTNNPIYGT